VYSDGRIHGWASSKIQEVSKANWLPCYSRCWMGQSKTPLISLHFGKYLHTLSYLPIYIYTLPYLTYTYVLPYLTLPIYIYTFYNLYVAQLLFRVWMKPFLRRFKRIFLCRLRRKMKKTLLEGLFLCDYFFSSDNHYIKQPYSLDFINVVVSHRNFFLRTWSLQGNQQQKCQKECNNFLVIEKEYGNCSCQIKTTTTSPENLEANKTVIIVYLNVFRIIHLSYFL
jgi:hypothetical protein